MAFTWMVALTSCASVHAFTSNAVSSPPHRSRSGTAGLLSTPDGRSNDVFHIQNTPRAPMGPRGPQNLMYQTIQGERAHGQVAPGRQGAGGWAASAAIQGERARDNAAREYNDYQNRMAAANSSPPSQPNYQQQPYSPQQQYSYQQQPGYSQSYQQQPYYPQPQQPYVQPQSPYQQQYPGSPGYYPQQDSQYYPPPASVSYYPPPQEQVPPPPAPQGQMSNPLSGLPYGPPQPQPPPAQQPPAYAPPPSYAPHMQTQPPPPPLQYEEQALPPQPYSNPWPWRHDDNAAPVPRGTSSRKELPQPPPATPTSRSLIWQTLQSERASGQVSRSVANTGGASAMYHSLQAEGTRQGRRGVSASNAALNAQSVLVDASDAKVYERRRVEPYYLQYED